MICADPFSMWEDASAPTRGGTRRRPRSVEIKRAERWLKQKFLGFLTNTTPPEKNPETTRPKHKSKTTGIAGYTKKHQDADANRCDHRPEVMPEDGSYYKQFLSYTPSTHVTGSSQGEELRWASGQSLCRCSSDHGLTTGSQATFHPKQHSDMQLLENAHLISCNILFQAFFLLLPFGLLCFSIKNIPDFNLLWNTLQ